MGDSQKIYNLQLRSLDDVRNLYLDSKDRIKEIYASTIEEVLNDATLADLNSPSKTAIWRLWAFISAFNIWLSELLWIRYKVILDEAASGAQSHTLGWYRKRAFEYQHGDTVEVNNGVVGYPVIDESKQIIAACSTLETSEGVVVIKVTKEDSGDLTPLDPSELSGFSGYMNAVRDAGVVMQIVSLNPDVLKLIGTVYYNPTIQPLDDFKTAYETAVVDFLKNLPFDGKLRVIKFIDAMQNVDGFVDISINTLQASVAYSVTPLFQNVSLVYTSIAGYMEIDENFPLLDNVTFVANV